MAYINGVFIDDIVAQVIPRFKHEVLKKDRDKMILIDGREGSGKSMLAMQFAKALDNDFNLDKVAFNSDEFKSIVKDPKRKKGDCIVLDEAFSSASSRASLSQINQAMITVATEMRQLNLFVIIVLPSFFDLDKYFAIWRCDTLFHVYFNKKGNRGQYVIFPFKKKLKLFIEGKKTYNYNSVRSPYPPCSFNGKWVIDEQEYRLKKLNAFRQRKASYRDKLWYGRCIKLMLQFKRKFNLTNKEIGKLGGMNEEIVKKTLQRAVLMGGERDNIINNLYDIDVVEEEEESLNVVPKKDEIAPNIAM